MGTRLIGLVALSVGVYIIGSVCAVHITIRRKSELDELKKKFPYPVSNIAHRGGALLGPENTMFTFHKGVEEGFSDMLELDVRESKDGQIVVSHDQSLARACGETYEGILICNLVVGPNPSETLPQSMRRIPLEFKTHDIEFYEASADVPVDDSTRVCLLSEVLDALPNTPLHLDIKDKGKEFVTQVLDMIAKYKRESTIFLGSSQPENEAHISAYFKHGKEAERRHYRIFPSVRGVLITHLLFYTGLLPFVPLDIDVFSIPIFTSTMRSTMIEEAGSVTARIGMFLLSSQTLWKYLQSRGVAVVGWVINDEVDFEEGIKLPINGLMSDDPRKLHNYLVAHKDASKLRLLGN